MPIIVKHLRALVIAGLIGVLMGGCGFHLRSWELGNAYESIGLESAGRFDIESDLRRALAQTGVPLVNRDAQLVLELLDVDEELRTASVGGDARTAEFELIRRVRYAVREANGTYLAKPTSFSVSRRYFLDRDNLVGSNEEQALLRRELRSDLVQQIMRVLNAVSRAEPSGSSSSAAKSAVHDG